MKCEKCGHEFEGTEVKHSEGRDRGDGVEYGTSTYTSKPTCPNCGHDNSPDQYFDDSEECEDCKRLCKGLT